MDSVNKKEAPDYKLEIRASFSACFCSWSMSPLSSPNEIKYKKILEEATKDTNEGINDETSDDEDGFEEGVEERLLQQVTYVPSFLSSNTNHGFISYRAEILTN